MILNPFSYIKYFIITFDVWRIGCSILLFGTCEVFGLVSLHLRQLSCLDFLLGKLLLASLCILQLLEELQLLCLLVLRLFLLLVLDYAKDLIGMVLHLKNGILWKLFFFHLSLVDLLKIHLVLWLQGLLSILATLGRLCELLWFFLSLLHNWNQVLGPFLNSHFHSDIKGISDFGCLLVHESWSSFPGSWDSLTRDLTNFLGFLKLTKLPSLLELLFDGLKRDWLGCLCVEPFDDMAFRRGDGFLKRNLKDDWLLISKHL